MNNPINLNASLHHSIVATRVGCAINVIENTITLIQTVVTLHGDENNSQAMAVIAHLRDLATQAGEILDSLTAVLNDNLTVDVELDPLLVQHCMTIMRKLSIGTSIVDIEPSNKIARDQIIGLLATARDLLNVMSV